MQNLRYVRKTQYRLHKPNKSYKIAIVMARFKKKEKEGGRSRTLRDCISMCWKLAFVLPT